MNLCTEEKVEASGEQEKEPMGRGKKVRSSMRALQGALSSFKPSAGEPLFLQTPKSHSFPHLLPNFNSASSPTDEPNFKHKYQPINSERFFFHPSTSKSMSREPSGKLAVEEEELGICQSMAIVMESMDPYKDFRASMDEMVEAQGLEDWVALKGLLQTYLSLNQKSTHGFIIRAFVDLIVFLAGEGRIQQCISEKGSPLQIFPFVAQLL
ncbi:uncharacterized protein LOC144714877 [Wolffia australiana]